MKEFLILYFFLSFASFIGRMYGVFTAGAEKSRADRIEKNGNKKSLKTELAAVKVTAYFIKLLVICALAIVYLAIN